MVEKKKVRKRKVSKEKKFAVIKIGGSQEMVREGDLLEVPRMEGKEGGKLKAKDVLLVASSRKLKIGTPTVGGVEVTLKLLEHTKGEKVEIRKFRAKSRYRRKTGHRQPITKVQVEEISLK